MVQMTDIESFKAAISSLHNLKSLIFHILAI